jgi:hypothetical protein
MRKKRNRDGKRESEGEHLIDVKENNLRSKESLKRDDRQREYTFRENKRTKQGSESFTFFPFFAASNQSVKGL